MRRFGTKGQHDSFSVMREYSPAAQELYRTTTARLAASVLALQNNARALCGRDATQLFTMGGFAQDMLRRVSARDSARSVHTVHPECVYRADRFLTLSEGLVQLSTVGLTKLSRTMRGGEVTVLHRDWQMHPERRAAARQRAVVRERASDEAAAEMDVIQHNGLGDGVGLTFAGVAARVNADIEIPSDCRRSCPSCA